MNDILKIETILGYAANNNHLRASRDGKEFEGVLPAPQWSEEIIKRDGTVTDTVNAMRKLIRTYAWQTAKLAPLLKGKDVYETCQNIWNHLYTHIKYKEDDEGKEQLRTPALSWAIRRSRGIDCDDFTLFAGCLLYNLKIPGYIRIARYQGKNYFQHVYPVVPLPDKQYITIDAVLDEYDTEKEPIQTKDFLVMDTEENKLNGIDISVLGSIDNDTQNEISGILSGADFKEVNELEGLGQIATREEELNSIRNHLLRTKKIISSNPELVSETEHPESFLGRIDYALKYWDTDKREEALGILSGEEDRINELEGLSGKDEAHEDVELFYGLNGSGTFDVLGKAKRQRKFFSKVKQAVKKAGQGIKKVAKKIVRYNPLTVTIRAAVLLALKVNLLKVGSKLKWGYLTEGEAQAKGFDLSEWRKVKTQLAKAEKLFVNTLQGKAENFKRAILSGRAGKLSGTDTGLGVVVAATTAASTTAAVPFITKILNLLKSINYKKLVSKVNPVKLIKGKAKAEQSNAPTQEGGSAIPEAGEEPSEPTEPMPKEDEGSDNDTDQSNTASSGEEEQSADNKTGLNEETFTSASPKNLPAVNKAVQETIITKAMNWVKENKTTSVLIGAGAAFLIYLAAKPSKKAGLSGTRRGKKKKGKAKTNPPRTVRKKGKRRSKRIIL